MLKCHMIHSYPVEYYELYDSFKDGGTIRKWVNTIERMGRKVIEADPQSNLALLQAELPDDWEIITSKDNCEVRGKKNSEGIQVMKNLGALWIADKKYWSFTLSQLAEYINRDELYKFKGDMLEVLSEIFFYVFHSDEGVGIRDYAPVDIADDFGVDAKGVNVNGHNVAIQVKYRANPNDLIPYADIARTFTSAVCQLNNMDVVDHDHTIYLFTTAKGVTSAYEKVMGRKSVVISRGIISTKIDNNCNFWKTAFDLIDATMKRSPAS